MGKGSESENSSISTPDKSLKILFVCTNNLNCSPTALALLHHYSPVEFPLTALGSAGPYSGTTSRGADPRMLALLPNNAKAILQQHVTKELSFSIMNSAKNIIVMDEDSAWAVERLLKENKNDSNFLRFRSLFLDETIYEVPEPTSGMGSFDEAFKLIDRGIQNLIKKVLILK